jgi:hypothetical protein
MEANSATGKNQNGQTPLTLAERLKDVLALVTTVGAIVTALGGLHTGIAGFVPNDH